MNPNSTWMSSATEAAKVEPPKCRRVASVVPLYVGSVCGLAFSVLLHWLYEEGAFAEYEEAMKSAEQKEVERILETGPVDRRVLRVGDPTELPPLTVDPRSLTVEEAKKLIENRHKLYRRLYREWKRREGID